MKVMSKIWKGVVIAGLLGVFSGAGWDVSSVWAAEAKAPEVQHVKANGVNLAYTVKGQGQPLVLLHGGGLTSAMWAKQVDALAANYKVFAFDTRGHGGSDNPKHEFTYKILADDVVAFCKELGVEKPILMGYSDGGIVAMTVGIFHPGFARALVLGGSVPPMGQEDFDKYFDGMKAYYAPVTKRTALTDADLDAMYKAAPDAWDFSAKMHAKPGLPQYWRTLMKDVWLAWNNPQAYAYTDEQLQKLDMPVLVVVGDRDEFFQVANAARFARRLPRADLAVLPGGGHDVFRRKAELFNAVTLDFLGRVPH